MREGGGLGGVCLAFILFFIRIVQVCGRFLIRRIDGELEFKFENIDFAGKYGDITILSLVIRVVVLFFSILFFFSYLVLDFLFFGDGAFIICSFIGFVGSYFFIRIVEMRFFQRFIRRFYWGFGISLEGGFFFFFRRVRFRVSFFYINVFSFSVVEVVKVQFTGSIQFIDVFCLVNRVFVKIN